MFISKVKYSFSVFALGTACALAPSMADADHAWGPYHWARTTSQFTLKLGNNLATNQTNIQWLPLLNQASSDWNSPTIFRATSTPITTAVTAGQSKRNCSMVKGTTQVCNGKYGNNGWLGLATINIVNSVHITQGSAKMNDTYFNLAKYNNINEKQHVICQEIAHTFGLHHQSEDGTSLNTCMDYFSNTGANATSTLSTRPNAHDFDQLNIIYEHLDDTTTVAAVSSLASSGVDITNDPASWGQLVSQSAGGRSSIYERYNSDGSQTLTHVYWTIEAASDCPSCDHRYDNPGMKIIFEFIK